jgi:acetyl-CoA C-acetyltransferase
MVDPAGFDEPGMGAVLDRTGLKLDEIDLFEVNGAFAVQALAVARELGLLPDRTNPNGSSISLGHPIGALPAGLFRNLTHDRSSSRRSVR